MLCKDNLRDPELHNMSFKSLDQKLEWLQHKNKTTQQNAVLPLKWPINLRLFDPQ